MSLEDLFSLKGKVAIVTGGSRGIGFEMARALSEAGANIIIVNRKETGGNIAVEKLREKGADCLAIAADVSNQEDVVRVARQALECYRKIDILINCAGITLRKPTLEIQENEWDQIIDINLKGTFLCCQEVGKIMIKAKKGKIINVSSVAAFTAIESRIPYGASKAGVSQLTKGFALEWAPFNVNVNAIAPGPIITAFTAKLLSPGTSFYEKYIKKIPQGRFGSPNDLDGIVTFLASSASDYITGQTIFVDGGWTIS